MKNNIKTFLITILLGIVVMINTVIFLGCFFNIFDNAGIITLHHIGMNFTDSICYFVASGYVLILTVLYLKRKH